MISAALAATMTTVLNNLSQTKQILECLGFIINEEKSCMIPQKSCKYLGFIIDSEKFHIRLTDKKRKLIKHDLLQFKKIKRCTIRSFARLVGLLTSACPAVQYGWLYEYTKLFERCKYLALLNSDDYNSYLSLAPELQNDFDWWLKFIDNATNPIRDDIYKIEIFSDASKTGWGVACGKETANGRWSEEESQQHINSLELRAAHFGFQIFAKNLRNCQILLRIDNTTAISYVNRMGGVRFPHLIKISKNIWQFCEARNLFIFASYISSQDNDVADAESRKQHPDTEWELSEAAYTHVTNLLGMPEIDLFASRINNKCPRYISWNRDPGAFAINAFTIEWKKYIFYAFPPVAVLLKTLKKIITEGAEGIVVAPLWPTQPWFPLFQSLLCCDPIILKPSDVTLFSPTNSTIQPRLTLMAGRLSGKRS